MDKMDIKNDNNLKIDEEYEAQFFGFSSSDVVAMIMESLDVIMTNLIDSVSKKVKDQLNMSEIDVKEIQKQFLNSFKVALNNNKDELQGIVNNYVSIKREILLSPDECQINQYTQENEEKLMASYEEAKLRLKALTEMKSRLEACLGKIVDLEGLTKILNSRLENAADNESKLVNLQEHLKGLAIMEDMCASFISQLEL